MGHVRAERAQLISSLIGLCWSIIFKWINGLLVMFVEIVPVKYGVRFKVQGLPAFSVAGSGFRGSRFKGIGQSIRVMDYGL